MALTYEYARAAAAEHAALQWRLRALVLGATLLDAGDLRAAAAACQVAGADPFAYEPLAEAVDAFALALATPAAMAVQ